jgi:hypothetical protein
VGSSQDAKSGVAVGLIDVLPVQAHSGFSEEELYQTSKMIVAAQMARIHTVEWTPALLSNDVLNVSMHNNWCALLLWVQCSSLVVRQPAPWPKCSPCRSTASIYQVLL